jgi:hypothetical protein
MMDKAQKKCNIIFLHFKFFEKALNICNYKKIELASKLV